MKRRDFLKLSALAGTALSASPSSVFAQMAAGTEAKKFLVFLRIDGGWDVTLGLDPWLKPDRPLATDMFIEYAPDQVLNSGNLFFGPSGAPLLKHAKDISVVNGVIISDSDNGHEAADLYMASGNGQGNAPLLAFELESISPSPYGAIVDSRSIYLADRKVSYASADQLISAIDSSDPAEALKKSVVDARSAMERAIREVVNSSVITTKLKSKLKEMKAANPTLRAEHSIAASFMSGASKFGMMKVSPTAGFLDSHSNHAGQHVTALTSSFEYVSSVFDLFKSIELNGSSLFDQTLFVVTSEFARTPALNTAGGKDHNPMTNSVLLAGAGIKKGKMINSSLIIPAKISETGESYHMASPFDYSTGQSATVRDGANFIYPENLIATVATAVGADMNKFRSVPRGTKTITGLL